jgi:hypothetical protein
MKTIISLLFLILVSHNPETSASAQNNPMSLRLEGHGEIGTNIFQFEIVMDGFDRYYRKEWAGEPVVSEGVGFFDVHLIVGEFGGTTHKSWGNDGARGGGDYGEAVGKNMGELARRLWSGDKFIGVSHGNLRAEIEDGHYVEEFHEPISPNQFPLPSVILWTDNTSPMPQKTTTYIIEKVEFSYKHDPKFFQAAKTKYFPKTEQQSSNFNITPP